MPKPTAKPQRSKGAVLFDAALLAPDDRLGFWAAGGGLLALVSAALRTRGGGAGKDA